MDSEFDIVVEFCKYLCCKHFRNMQIDAMLSYGGRVTFDLHKQHADAPSGSQKQELNLLRCWWKEDGNKHSV